VKPLARHRSAVPRVSSRSRVHPQRPRRIYRLSRCNSLPRGTEVLRGSSLFGLQCTRRTSCADSTPFQTFTRRLLIFSERRTVILAHVGPFSPSQYLVLVLIDVGCLRSFPCLVRWLRSCSGGRSLVAGHTLLARNHDVNQKREIPRVVDRIFAISPESVKLVTTFSTALPSLGAMFVCGNVRHELSLRLSRRLQLLS